MEQESKGVHRVLVQESIQKTSPIQIECPQSFLNKGAKKAGQGDSKNDFSLYPSYKTNSSGKEDNERDLILWYKIKRGEIAALGELYDVYIDTLFPYGVSMSSDKVLVMDSIHDLFLDLYKYREKLADCPQVKFYLLKSLKRKNF